MGGLLTLCQYFLRFPPVYQLLLLWALSDPITELLQKAEKSIRPSGHAWRVKTNSLNITPLLHLTRSYYKVITAKKCRETLFYYFYANYSSFQHVLIIFEKKS